ncbi:MAG: response regulator [Verrucomicrobiota bacterium]
MEHAILIIDDQEDILRILEREFSKEGRFRVFTAVNCRNALDLLEEEQIDLVITDVRIGEENGFVLLKQLRERYPDLAVMMMTAYRSPGYRQQADQLGVVFFIEKPFAVSTLLQAVGGFFDHREAHQPEVIEATATPEAPKNYDALEHFRAVDLIQLFCLNGRQVLLTLNFPGMKEEGRIFIRKGNIWHVEFGAMQGKEAFYKIMSLGEAQLGIRNSEEEELPQTVSEGWEHLLMDAARFSDESTAAGPDRAAAEGVETERDPFDDFWKSARISKTGKLKLSQ